MAVGTGHGHKRWCTCHGYCAEGQQQKRREEIVKDIAKNKGKKLYLFFTGVAASADTAFALQCPSK